MTLTAERVSGHRRGPARGANTIVAQMLSRLPDEQRCAIVTDAEAQALRVRIARDPEVAPMWRVSEDAHVEVPR